MGGCDYGIIGGNSAAISNAIIAGQSRGAERAWSLAQVRVGIKPQA